MNIPQSYRDRGWNVLDLLGDRLGGRAPQVDSLLESFVVLRRNDGDRLTIRSGDRNCYSSRSMRAASYLLAAPIFWRTETT